MSMENHIKRLVNEHKALDELIDHMESSGSFDDETLVEKKRHRLHLKDEIFKLQHPEIQQDKKHEHTR